MIDTRNMAREPPSDLPSQMRQVAEALGGSEIFGADVKYLTRRAAEIEMREQTREAEHG